VSAEIQAGAAQIRPMRIEDLPKVLAIEARAYEFPWTEPIFKDCLKAGYSMWVLDGTAAIVGYGVLSSAAGEAHILNLCVDPRFQGTGMGRRLLNRLIDLARWHQAERVFLEVRPTNTRAIALYHRAGFCEMGHRPNYYPRRGGREDAVVMAKELLVE